MPCPKNQNHQGQVLIDIVVATGVFIILIHAVFSITILIYETLGLARTRIIARHLASEKIELLKNLPYNDLGTTTGIPNGIIPEFETITRNGLDFSIHTTIIYIDDPYDNQAPSDLLPTDYKSIRVSISWEGQYKSRSNPVTLVTNISPQGIETSVGGGTLSVYVIDGLAQPVQQAQVHIVNPDITPNIDMTLQTNSEGRVILPGAPPCDTCYHIEVTKENYTFDKTYTIDEVANPDKKPVTIEEGKLSEPFFVIDKTSQLTIYSYYPREQNFTAYPNVPFRITGKKRIGTDSEGEFVYKFDQTAITGTDGKYTFSAIEWDTYLITLPEAEDIIFTGIYPHQPFSLDPDQILDLKFAVASKPNNSLLLSLVDASSSAIATATATLKADDFIATKSSGLENDPDFGQTYFNNLESQSYDFTITHPSFTTQTGNLNVDSNTTETIILNQ